MMYIPRLNIYVNLSQLF